MGLRTSGPMVKIIIIIVMQDVAIQHPLPAVFHGILAHPDVTREAAIYGCFPPLGQEKIDLYSVYGNQQRFRNPPA